MANFKNLTAPICGANDTLNSLLTDVDKFQDKLMTNFKAEVDAVALKLDVEGNLKALEAGIKSLIPELPTLADLGLQDELNALKGLVPGSKEYLAKLKALKASFPNLDLDSLLNLDICDVPNVTGDTTQSDNLELAGKVSKKEVIEKVTGIVETGGGLLTDVADTVKAGITYVKNIDVVDTQVAQVKKAYTVVTDEISLG